MTYDFNGTKVHVKSGETSFVVTDSMGGSVSIINKKSIERELERGLWVEAYVYQVSDEGVVVVSHPMPGGDQ